jgi:hypothetical protein
MINIVTLDPLVAPVTDQELVDWARLDSDDPKIGPSLIMGTSLVISFLSLDLLQRTYTLTHDDWPTVGTLSGSKLSRQTYANKTRIDLLYANLLSITTVKVNNELQTTDDYRLIAGKPWQIEFQTFSTATAYYKEFPAIEIEYEAGYALATSIPDPIKQAVLLTASHLIMNSGCIVTNAVKDSGAAELLRPYAVNAGMVF